MASDERQMGEMQAQIEMLSSRMGSFEAELNRRTKSQKEWAKELEDKIDTTKETVIRLEGKLKGIDESVKGMKKTAGKLIWIILTPVLTALGLALMNLLK